MIRLANGGVPRRLTFDLMREMRRAIYHAVGHPDEIRCPQRQLQAYELLFPKRERRLAAEAEFSGSAWDGIPMLLDESLAADCIQWRRGGEVVGVIADLWFERATWCPTCQSPAPHLHPAVQHGGECQVCKDPFHCRVTASNTPERIRSFGLTPLEVPDVG